MDLEQRRRPAVTGDPPLGFAVAAAGCQLLIFAFPLDFSLSPLRFVLLTNGIGILARIASLAPWLSAAIAIAVAIALIRRRAMWTACGVCIGVGVIVATRVVSSILNALETGAWPWRADVVLLLDAATLLLLYLAAGAARREASAASS